MNRRAMEGAFKVAAVQTCPDRPEREAGSRATTVAFCDAALAQVTDAKLGDTVSYYGPCSPLPAAALGLVTGWSNHYSRQPTYLRLNWSMPPSARQVGM